MKKRLCKTIKGVKKVGLLSLLCLTMLAGCEKTRQVEFLPDELSQIEEVVILGEDTGLEKEESSQEESLQEESSQEESSREESLQEESSPEESSWEDSSVAEEESSSVAGGGKLVVIDAGHQAKGNSEKEPVGPGATEMKAKVTGGATGCSTGQKEYELNLAVAFYLRDELTERGYQVIMVRESHDVNISNSERAAVANNAGADAFIRIHANGSDNSEVSGTETLCQTPQNPYNAELYSASRSLSEKVLDGVTTQTGFKKRSVKETDTMSGINWCNVPVTIIEMGFLSNPNEDSLMYTEEYRRKIAAGIADGIDSFFAE